MPKSFTYFLPLNTFFNAKQNKALKNRNFDCSFFSNKQQNPSTLLLLSIFLFIELERKGQQGSSMKLYQGEYSINQWWLTFGPSTILDFNFQVSGDDEEQGLAKA